MAKRQHFFARWGFHSLKAIKIIPGYHSKTTEQHRRIQGGAKGAEAPLNFQIDGCHHGNVHWGNFFDSL